MTPTDAVRRPARAYMLTSSVERWIAVGVALAWGAAIALEAWPSHPSQGEDLLHGSHAGHIQTSGAEFPWTAAWLALWVLMIVAMMGPLTLRVATSISRAAYRDSRTVCVMVSLLVFTVLWVAAGLILASGARLASVGDHTRWWQVGWLVTAVGLMTILWPARRARLLWSCATFGPLAPSGWRGIVSSFRAGAVTWRRCAVLCGPVMAAMAVEHSMVVMVFGSASAWWEFAHPRTWRDPVPVVLLTAAAVVLTIAPSLEGGA